VADQEACPICIGVRESGSNETFGVQLLAQPAPRRHRPPFLRGVAGVWLGPADWADGEELEIVQSTPDYAAEGPLVGIAHLSGRNRTEATARITVNQNGKLTG
jgi:hypothetical protein